MSKPKPKPKPISISARFRGIGSLKCTSSLTIPSTNTFILISDAHLALVSDVGKALTK